MDNPGEAIIHRLEDGTVIVEHAAPTILVAKQLIDPPAVVDYVEGILTLDTAGEYRYCRVGSYDERTDIFSRLPWTDGPPPQPLIS